MTELQNLETRAKVCTGCHLITDPRLISSGHPVGADFDYVAGLEFLEAQGVAVGSSRVEAGFLEECRQVLEMARARGVDAEPGRRGGRGGKR